MNLAEFAESTHKNGGGSFSFNGEEIPTSGYMVGGVTPSVILDPGTTLPRLILDLLHFYQRNQEHLDKDGLFLGTWVDPETGKIYLDVSQRVADLEEALKIGDLRGEIAIWDVINGQEISVQDRTVSELI